MLGVNSKYLIVNFPGENFIINLFNNDVTAVGMDIVVISESEPDILVEVFGQEGLLGSTMLNVPLAGDGAFLGVSAPQLITRIEISNTNVSPSSFEGLIDICFGLGPPLPSPDGDQCLKNCRDECKTNFTDCRIGCQSVLGIARSISMATCRGVRTACRDSCQSNCFP